MNWKRDWFLIGMGGAILLAWLLPEPGAKGGWLQPELLTKAGVALVFFLHGAALSFAAMKQGAANWRLHLLVQLSVFAIFPLVGLGVYAASESLLDDSLRLGLFYLCALPSTVSSSVAMTALARGNVPAAVFNATLSSILGIGLTPLWLKLVLSGSEDSFELGSVVLDLVLWLILPLILGQISRIWIAGWAARNKPLISVVDRLTILMLVYTSFCDSMKLGIWTEHGVVALSVCVVVSLVLFYGFLYGVGFVANGLGFQREDRIAAIFCGSKKSMATGVPMANLMFANSPNLGLILLPILVYHSLQLIICGFLANKWREELGDESTRTGENSLDRG